MKAFYRLYVLQVFLTVVTFMVPTGIVRWIAQAVLVLVMFLLWLVLQEAVRMEEKEEQAQQEVEQLASEFAKRAQETDREEN